MLTELRLQNFEGFQGHHVAPLKPLTLIFGPNSSGKSALVHALALMRQSVGLSLLESSSPLLFKGPLVDLGDFRNAVYRHQVALPIGIGLTHAVASRPARSVPHEFESFDLSLKWSASLQRTVLDRVTYSLPEDRDRDVQFRRTTARDQPEVSEFRVVASSSLRNVTNDLSESVARRLDRLAPSSRKGRRQDARDHATLSDAFRQRIYRMIREARLNQWGFLPSLERPQPPDSADRSARENYEALFQWGSRLFSRAREVYESLEAVAYLGPLRSSPKRFESGIEFQPGYVGPIGEGTGQILNVDERLVGRVNNWLEHLEIPYTLQVQRVSNRAYPSLGELLALEMTDQRTNTPVSPSDVGFGISQVLPVVTQSLLAANRTVLIEQPEIHLHPRLQARLGALFAEVVTQTPGAQIIAETHSELLMLRVQRLIAEGVLQADQVQVLYVGAGPDGSWVRELPLSSKGHFQAEWPNGFFEERYEEWGT